MAVRNKYSNIDLSKYNGGYRESQQVRTAKKKKTDAENAVEKYGSFKYKNDKAYNAAMDAILNRKAFTYDLNGDAMYQQYKDMYMTQGKLAMMDTMGQASALTGGYGNSYAASVGNQAYQGYLQQLNGVIPELYNLALSAYNAEGDRLNNNFSIISTDRGTQFDEWSAGYDRLLNNRNYYSDNYNNIYSQDYGRWADNRDYDQSQYWNEYNAGYQQERDEVTDSQWQAQFDYQKERDEVADSQWQQEFNLARSRASGGDEPDGSGRVESSFKQTTGDNRFGNNGKLFTSAEYDDFKRTIAMHRSNEGRAQIIEDAVLEGKITETQANELLAKYGISDEDFKKYRGIE